MNSTLGDYLSPSLIAEEELEHSVKALRAKPYQNFLEHSLLE